MIPYDKDDAVQKKIHIIPVHEAQPLTAVPFYGNMERDYV